MCWLYLFIPAGVAVPRGGLMLWSVRHRRGGDAL
jgi:hypothetical protein